MRSRVLTVTAAVVAGARSPVVWPRPGNPLGVPGEPSVVTEGLTVPWAVGWLPDGQSALVTQRDDFHVWLVTRSGEKTDVGVVPESQGTGGEGGLMGVAVSPDWESDDTCTSCTPRPTATASHGCPSTVRR